MTRIKLYLVLNKTPLSRIGNGGVAKTNGALTLAEKKQEQDRGWRPVREIGRSKNGLGRCRSWQFSGALAPLQSRAGRLHKPDADAGRECSTGPGLLQTALGKLTLSDFSQHSARFVFMICGKPA